MRRAFLGVVVRVEVTVERRVARGGGSVTVERGVLERRVERTVERVESRRARHFLPLAIAPLMTDTRIANGFGTAGSVSTSKVNPDDTETGKRLTSDPALDKTPVSPISKLRYNSS